MIGIDVSHWNQTIDWQVVRSHFLNAETKTIDGFAIIKCTQGVWQFDDQYKSNKTGCEMYGVPHGVYHFFEPNVDGTKQADYFYNHAADPDLLVWVVDVEWMGDGLPVNLEKFIRRIQELTGEIPYIYTRPSVWNYYFKAAMPEWAKECPLWIADPDPVDSPDLPAGWDTWEFWQYSWVGSVPGIATAVDMNRFNGEAWEIPLVFGNGGILDEPVIPDHLQLEALVDGQNVRSGPALTYPIVGRLLVGQVLDVSDIAGSDAWAEIAPGQWAAVKIGTRRYLRVA